uniref:Uncharacterized protein n=1 Tax=Plectus sambesii TaxID=2011161 RepID=A0A914VWN3_9BILA
MKAMMIVALVVVLFFIADATDIGRGLSEVQRQNATDVVKNAFASNASIEEALKKWAINHLNPEQQQQMKERVAVVKEQIDKLKVGTVNIQDQISSYLSGSKIGKRAAVGDGKRPANTKESGPDRDGQSALPAKANERNGNNLAAIKELKPKGKPSALTRSSIEKAEN